MKSSISPEANLGEMALLRLMLLLCSRDAIVPSSEETFERCFDGYSIKTLIQASILNQVILLVDSRLGRMMPNAIPVEIKRQIRDERDTAILRQLSLIRAQTDLIRRVLNPLGARYAILKGAELSRELYSNPLIRSQRDIDILIESRALGDAAKMLVAEGYIMTNPACLETGAPIEVISKLDSVIELKSPEGIAVELHRRLDNSGCIFDSEVLLSRRTVGSFGYTLSRLDHLLYALFHHSRHGWNMGHWCADLLAFPDRGTDEHKELLAHGRQNHLIPTIEESYHLRELLAGFLETGKWSGPAHSRFGNVCLEGLLRLIRTAKTGIFEVEDLSHREPDFMFDWQKTNVYRLKFVLSRAEANLDDYREFPGIFPRIWVYRFLKPLKIIKKHFASRLNADAGV